MRKSKKHKRSLKASPFFTPREIAVHNRRLGIYGTAEACMRAIIRAFTNR